MLTTRGKQTGLSLLLTTMTAAALLLTGCGGGSDGAAGPAGPAGPPGPAGATPASATGLNSNSVAPTADAAAAFLALRPQIAVQSVTISSPPVVKFTVKDTKGNPIAGLGSKAQSATAVVANLTNLNFTLSKLVPGTNNSPSKWVSYIVTKPPTVAQQAGTVAASASCDSTTKPTVCGAFPSADTQGTLVDNGDGSYQYTFYRDIKQAAAQVASLIDSADGLSKKGDLGDVSYDPTLTHRLGIFVAGSMPGTGTNTPKAVQTVPPVPLVYTANIGYDFVPAGGTPTVTRDIVVAESCDTCHNNVGMKKGIGHVSQSTPTNGVPAGSAVGRNDPRLCVTCHTDQTKYGFPEAKTTATGYDDTDPNGYKRVNGESAFTYPRMIHQTHMGSELVKTGYNLNAHASKANGSKGCDITTTTNRGQCFNLVEFPQDQRNCTKCHDGSATNPDGSVNANKTANGDNWKTVPSRLACGACHDGINFATGGGITLANRDADVAAGKPVGTTATGHVGGAKADDSLCALCHDAASIPVYHATNNSTPHNPTVPAGLKNFKYEIKSVDATATTVKVVFRISMDGTPVIFLAPAAGMANPLLGFTGSPGFLLANAQAQDGVAAPVDFNNLNGSNGEAVSVSIANLLDTNKAVTSGTLAGPDANGYYTATIVGAANVFPAGAKMRTVGLQGSFSQTTAPGTAAAPIARAALSVVQTVTGDTARRAVIDPNKCGNCHEWFIGHGGSRIIGLGTSGTAVCVLCHNPSKKTSGRGIADATLLAYPFTASDNAILADWGFDKTKPNAALAFPQTSNNLKDMIHGIHAADDRTNPFRDVRDRTPSAITLISGSEILFPGVLKDCQTCHLPGTYSGAPANTLASTHEADNGVFLNGASRTTADAKAALAKPNPLDKVTTPFAAACVSCHDADAAKAHITLNGGQILVVRSSQNAAGESCSVCHGAGSEFDPVKVHQK